MSPVKNTVRSLRRYRGQRRGSQRFQSAAIVHQGSAVRWLFLRFRQRFVGPPVFVCRRERTSGLAGGKIGRRGNAAARPPARADRERANAQTNGRSGDSLIRSPGYGRRGEMNIF